MPKYMIDNTFSFQPKMHQVNSLRQKNALNFIIGLRCRGGMHNATCTRKTGKIEQHDDRASLCAAAAEFAVLRHTTQTHPAPPYLTKECSDSTWSGASVTRGSAAATLATAFRLELIGGGSSL